MPNFKFDVDAVGIDVEFEIRHDLELLWRVRRAIPVQIAAAFFVALHHQIDVRIMHALGFGASADLEIDRVAAAAVDQLVRDAAAGLEAGGVAGLEYGFAVVLDQHQLAFQHVDEFVFLLVPMPQRGGRARLDARNIDAELRETHDVAQRLLVAAFMLGLKLGGIETAASHRHLGDVDLGHEISQTRSMIVAVPMPIPMQSVTSAVDRSRRSSSSSTVPRIMAPVAPSGWPMAMAPPLAFILSGGMSKDCMWSITNEAQAWLSSNRSTSPIAMPAFLSTFSVTGIGPVSMIAGSEPTLAKALMRARGFKPAALPAALLPISTAAAPSTMPEELPGVCT